MTNIAPPFDAIMFSAPFFCIKNAIASTERKNIQLFQSAIDSYRWRIGCHSCVIFAPLDIQRHPRQRRWRGRSDPRDCLGHDWNSDRLVCRQ